MIYSIVPVSGPRPWAVLNNQTKRLARVTYWNCLEAYDVAMELNQAWERGAQHGECIGRIQQAVTQRCPNEGAMLAANGVCTVCAGAR